MPIEIAKKITPGISMSMYRNFEYQPAALKEMQKATVSRDVVEYVIRNPKRTSRAGERTTISEWWQGEARIIVSHEISREEQPGSAPAILDTTITAVGVIRG